MRIAVFTNQFPGRVTTFFSRDMRGLLEAGLDIDIFAIYPHEADMWPYVPDILNERQLAREKVHHISPLRALRYAKPWPFMKVQKFLQDTTAIGVSAARFGAGPIAKSAYVFLQAWGWADQYATNYDHILAYWANYSGTCAYLFHRLIEGIIPFSIYPHAGVDLYANQVFLKQKFMYADNIIVDCEFNRRFIEQLYPNDYPGLAHKIHLYHPGLDLSEFTYQNGTRFPKKIVGVGRFVDTKGFDYLLRAAHELKCRHMEPELELVGDGPKAGALKELAAKLQLENTVKFRGWLNPTETRETIGRAAMLAHPSTQLDDAVPNVIKEAMALGTPVVAANVAGIPELLDHGRCGILFPPRNFSALADGLETLLKNEVKWQEFSRTARQFAEKHFDLWRNGRQLADLLRSTKRNHSK